MNETHTLNGIKYVSRLITEEENTLIDRLRNDELGCQYCELGRNIEVEDLEVGIDGDKLAVFKDDSSTYIQISFCPFCRKSL